MSIFLRSSGASGGRGAGGVPCTPSNPFTPSLAPVLESRKHGRTKERVGKIFSLLVWRGEFTEQPILAGD